MSLKASANHRRNIRDDGSNTSQNVVTSVFKGYHNDDEQPYEQIHKAVSIAETLDFFGRNVGDAELADTGKSMSSIKWRGSVDNGISISNTYDVENSRCMTSNPIHVEKENDVHEFGSSGVKKRTGLGEKVMGVLKSAAGEREAFSGKRKPLCNVSNKIPMKLSERKALKERNKNLPEFC